MGRLDKARLAQVKATNDDLVESMGLLLNRRDEFSVEADRLGDVNGKEYSSVFQPFCCSGTSRKCLRCSWSPVQ